MFRYFLAISLIFAVSACAEPAGSGTSVSIPVVQILCTTARCRAQSSGRAFIVFTTSSCTNPAYGETVAGSTTLACSASGCTGNVTTFTGSGGSAYNIPSGTYSVCAILDFNGNYVGGAIPGEDTTGSLANTSVGSGSSTKSVTTFTDI